jgi:hypothetical protein
MQPMKKQREKCAHNCFHSKGGNALSLIELIFAKVILELLIPVSCCVYLMMLFSIVLSFMLKKERFSGNIFVPL